ncbi:MAG: class I SAM-dependent methyltransferase [Proteobacteria bacterium]|nr:class I SAM-dependent methyltransferase [Pseudomonadota bacterium]
MSGGPQGPPCRRRDDCRLCGGQALEKVLALTPTPPANAFVSRAMLAEPQPVFPLDLYFCRACAHVQLLDVVDPRLLFERYVYVSGTSPAFVEHFRAYAGALLGEFPPPARALAVDVGSNDGTLLRFFAEAELAVLGVDPAREIAAEATRRGIETWPEFFTPALARRIRAERGPAAFVTANNVFAHVDDLAGLLAGVRALLAGDGVVSIEVSYLADVVGKTLFDTIYHEHLSYHSVKPLRRFLAANGFELIRARRVESHGGSLRAIAQLAGGPHRADGTPGGLIAEEESRGLDRPETLRAFAARIEALKARLVALVRGLKAEGRTIAGFGAPAKATTLMYHFGLGPEVVDFIVDDSPLKQGLFTPGLHVPVLPAEEIYRRRPDYLLLLAWNFAAPIIARHGAYLKAGGRFIVPLPELEVVGP